MSVEEILEKLNIIFDNTRFTKESLRNPDNVQEIYTLFLMEFDFSFPALEIGGSSLFKPRVLDVLSGINYLFSRICPNSEEFTFELSDLISPVLSRTIKFLWCLCNYFMHSNNIFQHDNLVQANIEKAQDEKSSAESQINHYRQCIQEKRRSRGIEKHKIDTLNKDIKEKDESLQKLSDEISELKKRTDPILNEMNEENSIYEERSKKLKELNMMRSYNHALHKNEELEEVLSEKNSRKTLLNGTLRTLEDRLSTFEIHLLKQLLELKRELKKTQQENKQNQMTIKEESWNLGDASSEIAKEQQKNIEVDSMFKNLELKWNKKKQLKLSEMEEYSKMMDLHTQKKTENDIVLKELQEKVHKLNLDISCLNEDWSSLNNSCNQKYSDIILAINLFSEHVNLDN